MSGQAVGLAPQTGKLHLLLVEDNPIDVELVQRELHRSGLEFTAVVVQGPEEFAREIEGHCPDLVIADYNLPQWRGMDALEVLKRERPGVPLILVTGALGEMTAVECFKNGIADYVLKGSLTRLPVAVRRALEERKLREQQGQAQHLFERAVESAPSGIVMTDESGRIVLVNNETERLFGYRREELLGHAVELLIPSRFREEHPGHRAAYRGAPTKRSMGHGRDLFGLRKDGTEFPVEVGLNPVQTATGTQVLVAVVDITERKRAEQKQEEYTRELQRSNAELEQFAYIASHDLQEPLRMVASYTELLGERYKGKLDDNADKYIGYAVDGARRMQRLIHDLLAYARVSSQAKPVAPTDASAVLSSVLALTGKSVESSQAEIIRGELPTIMADEMQLGQVFQNLIANALKFHGEKPPQVKISAKDAGDMWQFSVADNGIGMEMENAGRIFQMFQRLHTRDEYEGTGIGLAISKRIVERHGGKIWFDSAPGKGTTFHFTIPKITTQGV
jgi:PAS domain S-box-containing protein